MLDFNTTTPTKMHVDLNSCFASVEQQANPYLRGRPVVVAAYTTPSGCIIAPSVEAKELGIRVGMRVRDGRAIFPKLVVLPPDPNKYRVVHLQLKSLLEGYTDKVVPKSIDEFVLDFKGTPVLERLTVEGVGEEIKKRIKREVGDWLRVSMGIGANRWLAKTAANLKKPDGLEVIGKSNFLAVYRGLELVDLCGIKRRNALRLNGVGIFSVEDFYRAEVRTLRSAFGSVMGDYWYWRLRGFEIDEVEFGRKSFGNSVALGKPVVNEREVAPVVCKLVEKMGARLRRGGYQARGVHVAVRYRDGSWWHRGRKLAKWLGDSREIFKEVMRVWLEAPRGKPIRDLAVSCFDLAKKRALQLELFGDKVKGGRLISAIDEVNERWGQMVVTSGRMLGVPGEVVQDRISYGGVKELEEIVIGS
jgi:DNA polymerase-4